MNLTTIIESGLLTSEKVITSVWLPNSSSDIGNEKEGKVPGFINHKENKKKLRKDQC